jgi:hypothetical protein
MDPDGDVALAFWPLLVAEAAPLVSLPDDMALSAGARSLLGLELIEPELVLGAEEPDVVSLGPLVDWA